MATYSANPAAMSDLEDLLRQETNRIQESLSNLAAQAKFFAENSSGEAVFSYSSAQEKWNSGMEQMEAALQRASTNLGNIRDNIVRTDNAGAALF
jgi:WXG100 family type VII secretion target